MRNLISTLSAALLIGSCILYGAPSTKSTAFDSSGFVYKKPGQTDSGFVFSNPPPGRTKTSRICYGDYELIHGPVTAKWNSQKAVFAFYEYSWTECVEDNAETYSEVDGYVFVPTDKKDQFKRVFIGSFGGGGREPATVEAVFFANADRDKFQEVGVLTSFEGEWKNAPEGRFYSADFFDDMTATKSDSLIYLKDVSENKVKPSCSAYDSDGKLYGKYYYRTVAEVKKRLKKLGY